MTTKTKQRRQWESYPSEPNVGEYITLRPDFCSAEGVPTTDEEGNRLVLPLLDINSIEIQMPKLGSPKANHRITDVANNSFVENVATLSYVREKLNGNTIAQGHDEKEDCIWIVTNSPDIIRLWCMHHHGEFVGQANVTFGSMPLKMRVNAAELAGEQYHPGSHRESGLLLDGESVAWSYVNDWNYVVTKDGVLSGIKYNDPLYLWANNIQAAQYTKELEAAEDDDS